MSRTRSINKPLTSYPLNLRPWVGFAIREALPENVPTLPGPHAYNHCILSDAGVENLKRILDKKTWWKEIGKELNDKGTNNRHAPGKILRGIQRGDRFKSKLRLKNAFHDGGESYYEDHVRHFKMKGTWY